MVMMTTAPSTQAHTAPGPASPAARQAPNSQPEPMMEPRPVIIRARVPTCRRVWIRTLMPEPASWVRDEGGGTASDAPSCLKATYGRTRNGRGGGCWLSPRSGAAAHLDHVHHRPGGRAGRRAAARLD